MRTLQEAQAIEKASGFTFTEYPNVLTGKCYLFDGVTQYKMVRRLLARGWQKCGNPNYISDGNITLFAYRPSKNKTFILA
jgi:hypothetical protein